MDEATVPAAGAAVIPERGDAITQQAPPLAEQLMRALPRPMSERESVAPAVMIIVAVLIATLGGTARLIYTWPSLGPVMKSIGNLLVSVASGLLVFLPVYEQPWGVSHPYSVVALTLAAGWLGGDVIDRLARRFVGVKAADYRQPKGGD